ncbi:MAG: tyrosine-type recombinase/integrase [Flavobacteriales bacterium]
MNFDSFITYLTSEKRSSPHTVSAYQLDLEQFSTFCRSQYEITSPHEVSPSIIRTWLAGLMEDDYSPTSIHRKSSSLNAWFRYLIKLGELEKNPMKGLSKPKIPKRLPQYLEENQTLELQKNFQRSENTFSSVRNELLITLFYETGIRLSELMQLRDRDIDFGLEQIKVLGKRNKMRYVPVGKRMTSQIQQYMDMRNDLNLNHGEAWLFVSDKGQKISKSLVYSTVKTYLSSVTTQSKRSPHVLRHTFATHMLNNGADLNVIKELLGHSSLAATQVYTHNSIEKLKGIHSKLHPRSK